MSTKHFSVRIITELSDDTTDTPIVWSDTTFTLDGYEESRTESKTLAPSAVDEVYTIPDASALYIYSLDYPFSLRLATGQKQLTNIMSHLVVADDVGTKAVDVSILLTGNTTNASKLKILVLEKV